MLSGELILVTGGAGFIGSHLVEYLLNQTEARVRVVDNLSTGKIAHVEMFSAHPRYEFVFGDLSDLEFCRQVTQDVTRVTHQAALGSVPRSMDQPSGSHLSNDHATFNLMVACQERGIKRFVYASSSAVYGDAEELPKREAKTGLALSPYAATKQIGEVWGQIFHRCYGMETIGLRYFNVFGPRQDPHGAYAAVIPKFIHLLRNQQPPTINGDGEYSRDFTYVANIVQGNLRALTQPASKHLPMFGRAYNIGAGGRVTLNQLYHALRTSLGSDLEPIYGPNRPGDIPHSNADVGLAKEILGYQPEVSFEEGIQKTVDWFLTS